MNRAVTMTMALQGISEKFRRRMRMLCWETLDDGVVFFFRVRAGVEQIKQAVHMMPVGGLHLLANR